MPKEYFKRPFVRSILFRLLIPLHLVLICLPVQADYWHTYNTTAIDIGSSFSGFNNSFEAAEFLCGYYWGDDPEPGRANGWWVIEHSLGGPDENPDNPSKITHLCGNSWW